MKRIVVFILALTFCMSASAATLSPGLDIIKSKISVSKTAATGTDIIFKAEDFEKALGVKKLDKIVILALPPASDGIMKIGGIDLVEGQTVSRENIEMLRFLPSGKGTVDTSFTFKNASDKDEMGIVCRISLTDGVNFAPIADKKTAKTYRYVSLYKKLSGSDGDGDMLTFEIMTAPEDGVLTLTDSATGAFVYTPKGDFTGTDKFTYRVIDSYGNTSEEASVKIKVLNSKDVYFDDMRGHWAHAAAISMYREGIIDAENMCFDPTGHVSRGEFLVWAMKALDIDPADSAISVFADEGEMSEELRSYLSAAVTLGAVKGYSKEAGLYFNPDDAITRAEACVILDRLADFDTSTEVSAFSGNAGRILPAFADATAVPAWAQDAMYTLVMCGVITGTDDGRLEPDAIMTRAEAAQLLSTVFDMMD